MDKFIRKPDIDMYCGVKISKDTVLEYKNEFVTQSVKDLVLRSITRITGEGFESTQDTTIFLNEGDVLIFEEEKRGYIKPVEDFVSVDEAIKELGYIKN